MRYIADNSTFREEKYNVFWYPSHKHPIGDVIHCAGYDIEKLDLKEKKNR